MSSVYWIAYKDHTDMFSQGYIGFTNNFEQRLKSHKKSKQNAHLRHAVQKYGWDNLVKKVLVIGEESYCLEIEAKLRPNDKMGWNIVSGGGKPPVNAGFFKKGHTSWLKGKNQSEEIKQKVSIGVAKLWQDPEYRQRMSDSHKGKSNFTGKKHSVETIEKMKIAKIGKKVSDETRKKMSESQQKRIKGVS